MSDCQSGVGGSYARAKKMKRDRFGTKIKITKGGVAGRPVVAVLRKAEPRDREYLPEKGKNVAFSDVRVYETTPADVVGVSEGDGLTEQEQAFTIIGVPPADVMAGVPHTQVLICYRTPSSPATADANPAGADLYPTPDATF